MIARPANKYSLRDLHKEIDLYDRKISYAEKFEAFDSEADRVAATAKLAKKRDTLVKQALEMAANGIEFDPKDLPRSFKAANGEIVDAAPAAAKAAAPPAVKSAFGAKIARFEAEQQRDAGR